MKVKVFDHSKIKTRRYSDQLWASHKDEILRRFRSSTVKETTKWFHDNHPEFKPTIDQVSNKIKKWRSEDRTSAGSSSSPPPPLSSGRSVCSSELPLITPATSPVTQPINSARHNSSQSHGVVDLTSPIQPSSSPRLLAWFESPHAVTQAWPGVESSTSRATSNTDSWTFLDVLANAAGAESSCVKSPPHIVNAPEWLMEMHPLEQTNESWLQETPAIAPCLKPPELLPDPTELPALIERPSRSISAIDLSVDDRHNSVSVRRGDRALRTLSRTIPAPHVLLPSAWMFNASLRLISDIHDREHGPDQPITVHSRVNLSPLQKARLAETGLSRLRGLTTDDLGEFTISSGILYGLGFIEDAFNINAFLAYIGDRQQVVRRQVVLQCWVTAHTETQLTAVSDLIERDLKLLRHDRESAVTRYILLLARSVCDARRQLYQASANSFAQAETRRRLVECLYPEALRSFTLRDAFVICEARRWQELCVRPKLSLPGTIHFSEGVPRVLQWDAVTRAYGLEHLSDDLEGLRQVLQILPRILSSIQVRMSRERYEVHWLLIRNALSKVTSKPNPILEWQEQVDCTFFHLMILGLYPELGSAADYPSLLRNTGLTLPEVLFTLVTMVTRLDIIETSNNGTFMARMSSKLDVACQFSDQKLSTMFWIEYCQHSQLDADHTWQSFYSPTSKADAHTLIKRLRSKPCGFYNREPQPHSTADDPIVID